MSSVTKKRPAAMLALGLTLGCGTAPATEAPVAAPPSVRPAPAAHAPTGERRSVRVRVTMDPRPATLGGNLLYAGFASVDAMTGRPAQGARPTDHGVVARWIAELPVEVDVPLVPGLYYVVMYSEEAYARPSDRVAPAQRLEAGDSLSFVIPEGTVLPRPRTASVAEPAPSGGPAARP